jgi:K+-transporting ATPase ATPase C chain
MYKHLKPAFLMLLIWTALAGAAYPLAVTGLAQLFFSKQANGSLILDASGKPLGSRLIGQSFSGPKYFWGRPSATSPYPDNAAASSGSNLGPANPALAEAVNGRIQALKDADPGNGKPIPVDLVTASGSGLDPHLGPEAARWQVPRVAAARRVPVDEVRAIVDARVEGRTLGFLGEPRVNVLLLNLDLDKRFGRP